MPDLVETMYSANETPWHHKGVVCDYIDDPNELAIVAGMNWEAHKRPVLTPEGVEIPGYFAIQRGSDGRVLSIMQKKYTIVQPTECLEFFKPWVDLGAKFETAGVLDEGRIVWALASMGQHEIKRDDVVSHYALLANSYDGSLELAVYGTDVRVVCNNTLGIAKKEGRKFASLRHTRAIHKQLEQTSEAFRRALGLFDKNAERMRQLAQVEVQSEAAMKQYVSALFPARKAATPVAAPMVETNSALVASILANATIAAEVAAEETEVEISRAHKVVMDLFEGCGVGIERDRSWWAAYNAVTEYVSHKRGGKRSNDDQRLYNATLGTSADLPAGALDLAHDFATGAVLVAA